MTLAYLATPYTKYPRGLNAAWKHASRLAGRLMNAGVNVYSPIAHCHALSKHGRVDALDLAIWYPHCELMAERCDVLIVAHLPTWEDSVGIQFETEIFERAKKPIFDVDPKNLKMVCRARSLTFAQVARSAEMRRAYA